MLPCILRILQSAPSWLEYVQLPKDVPISNDNNKCLTVLIDSPFEIVFWISTENIKVVAALHWWIQINRLRCRKWIPILQKYISVKTGLHRQKVKNHLNLLIQISNSTAKNCTNLKKKKTWQNLTWKNLIGTASNFRCRRILTLLFPWASTHMVAKCKQASKPQGSTQSCKYGWTNE